MRLNRQITVLVCMLMVFGVTSCSGAVSSSSTPLSSADVASEAVPAQTELTEQTEQTKTEEVCVHVASDGSDVTGDGTEDMPYATVSFAAGSCPGSVIEVHGGEYGPVKLGPECSGSKDSLTVIRAAEGETPVIRADKETGISIRNVSHVSIEGLRVEGGVRGIEYTSTRDDGISILEDISIRNCTVCGIRGEHGICVYAYNDRIPVTGISVEGCEVYDCECGSSESVVLNGNIDGFVIAGNTIHDNNNIGIDMIGFEGTAKHPDGDSNGDAYDADFVRHGVCRDNVVYNISTHGNSAYLEDGEYDLCAGGIYVDGGQEIEIYNNYIFNCDIGLEAATEHSPEDDVLFRVSGIKVHDNVIAYCNGWAGMSIGGYDRDLGFTEDSVFEHNTLVDNKVQIAIQRSRNNRITSNLIIGGDTCVEMSEAFSDKEGSNDISGNVLADTGGDDAAMYGRVYKDRSDVINGFRSLDGSAGSRFVPDEVSTQRG